MKQIYVITGQTATGKTSYAINLANKIGGDIINADSRQVYAHLDIVTGKDLHLTDGTFNKTSSMGAFDIGYYSLRDSTGKVWLYDIVDPSVSFSTYDYKMCALTAIDQIMQNGKIPIIVGGSYLYLKNLLYNTVNIQVPPDEKLRMKLSKLSVIELQSKLQKLNSQILSSMNNSDRNNPHRLVRKIEIESYTAVSKNRTSSPIADTYTINIAGFRHKHIEHMGNIIEKRVQKRIQTGAVEETALLLKRNYSTGSPGLNAIGYRQIISYIQETMSMQNLIQEWTTKEVQYAKRQYSFMKQNADIKWIEI